MYFIVCYLQEHKFMTWVSGIYTRELMNQASIFLFDTWGLFIINISIKKSRKRPNYCVHTLSTPNCGRLKTLSFRYIFSKNWINLYARCFNTKCNTLQIIYSGTFWNTTTYWAYFSKKTISQQKNHRVTLTKNLSKTNSVMSEQKWRSIEASKRDKCDII